MSNAERYDEVNELHALGYPAITREEAGKAAKRLIAVFGQKSEASAARGVHMRDTSLLRRWTDGHESGARRVWVAPKPTTGMRKGWGRLIHDIGHMVYRYRHPHTVVMRKGELIQTRVRPHGDGENCIELEVAQYVRNQTDWLTGTLKDQPKPKIDKVVQLTARLEMWQRKQARAERAIRKLNRRLAYYRKKAN